MKQGGDRLFVRVTAGYLYLMLTLFLLFCGSGGYEKLPEGKLAVFWLLCGGYLLVMAVLGVELALVGELRLPSPARLLRASSWPQRFALLYLLFSWMSALSSPYFPDTVLGVTRREGALTLTVYTLCFLLLSVFGRVSTPMLWVMGGGVVGFCLLSMVQLAGYNPFALYPEGYTYQDAYTAYSGAYLGTLGNVGLVAAWLCLVIPMMWIALLRLKGPRRFWLLLPLGSALAVLVWMKVDAGLVGVLAGTVLALPVVLPLSSKGRRMTAAGVVLLGLAGAAFVYGVDVGTGPLHELNRILHGVWDPSFGSGRIHIWQQTLARIPSQIWLGSGPDTMAYAALEPFTRYDPALGGVIVSRIDTAHNEYLNVLFHQGIFALGTYLALLCSLALRWIRAGRGDGVAALLGGGVLCCCIQGMFGISMYITAPFFWLAMGLLEYRCRTVLGQPHPPKKERLNNLLLLPRDGGREKGRHRT